jgi:uncharacterized BrkB/YihY/UPF0761 family membrane protein
MVSSIAYLVLGIFALVILIGIIIIICNQITIAAAYKLFKKKLKVKQAEGCKLIKVKKLPALNN